MYILGINATYHDSSACLVKDGVVLAAAEEERFTGVKHGKRPVPFSAYELPFHAIDYCLATEGLRLVDVGHVAYSYDPSLLPGSDNGTSIVLPLKPAEQQPLSSWQSPWDPLFLSYIHNAARQLAHGAPHHLKKRFSGASPDGPYKWHYVPHHLAHAESAFRVSPFTEAAVMTIDGRGERTTTAFGMGRDNRLELFGGVEMPSSLGLLYERVTSYLGFLHSSDEYKVMALAAFGRPALKKQFQDLVSVDGNGTFLVKEAELQAVFGPAREKDGPWEQRHYDIACSLQAVLEETVLELARWLQTKTGMDSLCLAGGVALNCVMNSVLRTKGPFRRIWVQPAAGDAGTALGAALHVDSVVREPGGRAYGMDTVYLGPCFSDREIEEFLIRARLPYRKTEHLVDEVADLLMADAVVGWFQGRMEFGPRALGGRSILASPLHASMQARLNELKDREDFRPVAPVVLEEEAPQWFLGAGSSPFMLFTYPVRPDRMDRIPAVRHVDGTARIQTINRQQHARYYELIKAFQERSGVPVLVNTSFNTRGRPIVCSPRDAVECFYTSPLDALAIGNFLLKKPGV